MTNTNTERDRTLANITAHLRDEDDLAGHCEAVGDALIAAFDAGRRAAQWDAIEACRALHEHVTNAYDEVPADMLDIVNQARRAIGEPVSVPDDRETDDPT